MSGKAKNIIVVNEVESTNNYANQLILSNAVEGTVVLAQYQSKGRGQIGNRWESEAGKNMLASIILYPNTLSAAKQFTIAKFVSLALADFLRNEIDGISIKWPNDIYVGNKKIAGILIENSIKGSNLFASVLGIGLNLNQEYFLSDAPNPISLKQITGKNYKIESVASEIRELIFYWYKKIETNNFAEIDSAYFSQLFRKREWKMYSKEETLFEAKIIGIGEFGQLQLEKRDGTVEEFMFKELEFVIG
ncbi:MAG: biotin--[acetyl-CoA-carboxylase] ligase [Draconibacterium sp.]|nr:biotin--[acetyl-CoA-carboxylase] ligase [Draconibacterium sp.]